MRSRYASGKGKTNDTACRVINRFAADASTPACHAVTTVRKSANAITATPIPVNVKKLRSL
jgi:hypothetical protein